MTSDFSSRQRQRGSASAWIFGGFSLVALFFLLTEHRAHVYGLLPYLLLGSCLVMHMFHGHGGHGSHGGHGGRGADEAPPQRDPVAPPGAPKPNEPAAPAAHHHH